MTEKEYKQCISQALCPEYDQMVSDVSSEHTFSPGFEKQMNKLNQEQNKTVIIVTHDSEIASQCGRVIEISDGEIKS